MDNMVLLVVVLIFVVSVVVGYIRGLLKIGLSLLSTVITMVIVVFLSPYVGDALIKYTPIDEMIEEKCMEGFAANMSGDMLLEKDLSGTALAGMSQEDLQKIEGDNLEIHGINAQAFLQAIGDIPLDQQIQQVGDSVLPDFVKEALLENNNNMIYEELGANNFWEYVSVCHHHREGINGGSGPHRGVANPWHRQPLGRRGHRPACRAAARVGCFPAVHGHVWHDVWRGMYRTDREQRVFAVLVRP